MRSRTRSAPDGRPPPTGCRCEQDRPTATSSGDFYENLFRRICTGDKLSQEEQAAALVIAQRFRELGSLRSLEADAAGFSEGIEKENDRASVLDGLAAVEYAPRKSTEGSTNEPAAFKAASSGQNGASSFTEQLARIVTRSAQQQDALLQKEKYLLKVCGALMISGAPTHRIEEYMHMTGKCLDIKLQSFYMPGCMIISFNDGAFFSKDVHIIRLEEALNLCKLDDVRKVYKAVVHDEITPDEAIRQLDDIVDRKNLHSPWTLVLLYGLASASIGPFSYGARLIDLPITFLLGSLLGFMQLILAERSRLYRHVFEITAAILTSFIARGFGSINLGHDRNFCFSSMSQACLVMILPGFTITNSALELQSKNMVSGAVRMVYGIIFVLFLAFGIMIGVTLYGALDGNATSAIQCRTEWPLWWQAIFVPLFTVFYVLINQGRWKHMLAMVAFSTVGWLVNHYSAQRFKQNRQIAQALGALASGVLANIYSRLTRSLAYSLVYPAIFVQVPGSLAASGSLLSGISIADDITGSRNANGSPESNASLLQAGYAMVEIAIGITVGLSASALIVYPFGRKKAKSGVFSF